MESWYRWVGLRPTVWKSVRLFDVGAAIDIDIDIDIDIAWKRRLLKGT